MCGPQSFGLNKQSINKSIFFFGVCVKGVFLFCEMASPGVGLASARRGSQVSLENGSAEERPNEDGHVLRRKLGWRPLPLVTRSY